MQNAAACIQGAFVSVLTVAGWLRPLDRIRQLKITLLFAIAIGAIVLGYYSNRWLNPFAFSILHDWLPAPLLLLPYWQVGQFFTSADPQMESRLVEFDHAFFRALRIQPATVFISPAFGFYLELAYVLVYPLVPLGLLTLEVTGLGEFVNYYWIVVLLSTYVCFGMTPFVRAMPPRALANYEHFHMPRSSVEWLNHFMLRNASIQAITFPSGHVASAVAAALVLLRVEPWIGLIFLLFAVSIAVATVLGGYHYAADVLTASVVALIVFAATLWMKPV
jgi:membrane-associated phospholipid phosphatase